jgi:hypothetical protein
MAVPGTWLLADARPWSDLTVNCWSLLQRAAGIEDLLTAIMHGGHRSAPGFALVRFGAGETRAVVGAGAVAELRFADGVTATLRADGNEDWADRRFPGLPTALRLLAARDGDDAAEPEGLVLPLACGVVLASAAGLGLDGFTASPIAGTGSPQPVAVTHAAVDQPVEAGRATAVDDSRPDINLDGFLFHQTTEDVSRTEPALPLDDLSWLGGQAQRSPDLAEAVTPAPPTQAATPAPPVRSAASPNADSGLSFDAEATTFRPGRAPVQVGGPDQSIVLAVACPAGHPNPPQSAGCRRCGVPIPPGQFPRPMPRPALGQLRLSTGEVHPLDRGFLLGRNPTARDDAAGPPPNVLRLISRDGDVSRNHAEIRLDGWQVVVADLGSMNGTFLSGPGIAPRVLSGGEEHVIEPGCVVTLAHDVWIAYEVGE